MPLVQPPELDVTDTPRAAPSTAPRARVLAVAAVVPLVTGYAAVAALLALVTAVASRAQFSTVGVLIAAAPGWLAAHQVPVSILGHQLSVLPLLPTILLCVFVARAAATAADRLDVRTPQQAAPVIGTMAGAHAVFGFALALIVTGSELHSPVFPALLVPGLLSGLSATAAVAKRSGLLLMFREWLDESAPSGMRAGVLGLAGLVAAGAAVYALGLVLSFSTTRQLFAERADGFGSGLGMFLLSVAYLPNAVLGATSFTLGPGISLGGVTIGPFEFIGGPVPSLPILAPLPETPASWWPALLALPAVVGGLVGWTCRRVAERPLDRLRTVGVAGVVAALGCVLLGVLVGGRLGSGPFDPLSVPVPLLSVSAFVCIAVPGGVVAWFTGPRPERVRATPDDLAEDEVAGEDGPAEDTTFDDTVPWDEYPADEPDTWDDEPDTDPEAVEGLDPDDDPAPPEPGDPEDPDDPDAPEDPEDTAPEDRAPEDVDSDAPNPDDADPDDADPDDADPDDADPDERDTAGHGHPEPGNRGD